MKFARPVSARSRSRPGRARPETWQFRLYIAGQTPRSLTAFANLRRLCEQHLPDRHHIEVIDLMATPERGREDQILALPTLIRRRPAPFKRLIGNLSNTELVLLSLELPPTQNP